MHDSSIIYFVGYNVVILIFLRLYSNEFLDIGRDILKKWIIASSIFLIHFKTMIQNVSKVLL